MRESREKLTRVVGIEQAETGNEEVDSSQAEQQPAIGGLSTDFLPSEK
jgi:hypothetical protein